MAAGVTLVVGTYGSMVCMPSRELYEWEGVLHINYGCTRVDLSARSVQYYFRTSGRDDSQASFFVEYVIPLFEGKRIAVMHDNTAYALGVAEDVLRLMKPPP